MHVFSNTNHSTVINISAKKRYVGRFPEPISLSRTLNFTKE